MRRGGSKVGGSALPQSAVHKGLSSEEKFNIVLETASLNEDQTFRRRLEAQGKGPGRSRCFIGTSKKSPVSLGGPRGRRIEHLSPNQIVPVLADQHQYIASESTFYRVLLGMRFTGKMSTFSNCTFYGALIWQPKGS